MDTSSIFQNQYPLHPKKFIKKVLEKIIHFFALCMFMGLPIVITSFTIFQNKSFSTVLLYAACFFLLLLVVLLILYSFYVKAYIDNYFYTGGDDFLTIKKGVFAPSEIHVQYQKIQDVYVDQDVIDRLMGLYDVHIASATFTSGIEAHIDGVDKTTADGLKNFLFSKMKGEKTQPSPVMKQEMNSLPRQVIMSEDISSKTYPIESAWIILNIIQTFVFGAIAIGFICVFAYARNQGKLASAVTTVNTYTPHLTTYIILILGLVFFIISVVHSVLWKNRFAFVFLPDFISIQQGVIGREEKSLPYNTIQDVTVRQGVWERLCGVASVYIQNAAPSVTAMGGGRQGMPVFNGIIIPGQTFERANTLASTLKKILTTQDSRHTGV